MITVKCDVLKRSLKTDRIIAELKGDEEGPVFIFTAGLHGNEPTGVFALKDVFDGIEEKKIPFHGHAIALAGNMQALHANKRYIHHDLNRIWTEENLKKFRNGFHPEKEHNAEEVEMYELLKFLDTYFHNREDKEFFIDLHTTSAPSIPFIAVSDMHGNLEYSKKFKVPMVSNIDKYLNSPMLSHANYTGKRHISLAFEAGQHHHIEAFDNHKSFIYLSLYYGGFFLKLDQQLIEYHHEVLKKSSQKAEGNYLVTHHHKIPKGSAFQMNPGYQNFQTIEKGENLAIQDGEPLNAPTSGAIFMPLYQQLGSDGFFVIEKT